MPGFDKIADENCRILILGTFPGIKSQNMEQYYAHPQNAFWRILRELFEEDFVSVDFNLKKQLLLKNKIALWDVIYSHETEGIDSDDSHIKAPISNNFKGLFNEFLNIKNVYFNGGNAQKFFERLVSKDDIPKYITFHKLLSTSPANARYSFDEKLENWRQIKISN